MIFNCELQFTWLRGESRLPGEHDDDDDNVDGGAQDEDRNPPHQLDEVTKTV